jgi:8-oxo-dGTP diphosphatase
MTTKKVLLVSAVMLIDAENRVFLQQRPTGKTMAGLWEFPGGKVEAGETPEEALSRELVEELSIKVSPADFAPLTFASHGYDDFHLLMPVFTCRIWSGSITANEGQEFAWVAAGQLAEYPMPPADEPLLPALRQELAR